MGKLNYILIIILFLYSCKFSEEKKFNSEENIKRNNKNNFEGSSLIPNFNQFFSIGNESLLNYDIKNISNLEIDSLLKALLIWDQNFREKIVTERQINNQNDSAIGEYGDKMKFVDSVNFVVLSKIIETIGWPSQKVFSDSATSSAYFIILHDTDNDLSKFEEAIEKAFLKNEIEIKYYSILMDRILIRNGKKQKFGTHCKKNKDGSILFFNISDISKINKNRGKIGLDSLNLLGCELMAY